MSENQQGRDEEIEVRDGASGTEDASDSVEAWHEDQPPVDDFNDAAPDTDGEAAQAEEANPFEKSASDGKKRGNMVLFGVLGVVGLFALSMLYLQFGGDGGSAPKEALDINSLASDTRQKDLNPLPTDAEPAADKVDMASLYDIGKAVSANGTTAVMPGVADNYIVDKTNAQPEAVPAPSQNQLATATVTAQMPQKSQTASAQAVVAAPTVVPVPAASHPLASPPSPSVSATSADKRLADMEAKIATTSGRIDELQAVLDRMSAQITGISGKLDASGNVASLTAIEERVAKMEKHAANAAPAASKRVKETAVSYDDAVADDAAKAIPAPAEEKRVAKRSTRKVNAEASSRKTVKVLNAEPQKTWVLRAATPDAAWVSAGSGSKDLRKVSVGDTLPGVGKIRSITQSGDRWVVSGTSGTIR